ncbi:hypothetical protein ACLOJK_017511 [Asimina triloba]
MPAPDQDMLTVVDEEFFEVSIDLPVRKFHENEEMTAVQVIQFAAEQDEILTNDEEITDEVLEDEENMNEQQQDGNED